MITTQRDVALRVSSKSVGGNAITYASSADVGAAVTRLLDTGLMITGITFTPAMIEVEVLVPSDGPVTGQVIETLAESVWRACDGAEPAARLASGSGDALVVLPTET